MKRFTISPPEHRRRQAATVSNVYYLEDRPEFLGGQILRWWKWLTRHGETDDALDAWGVFLTKFEEEHGSEMFDAAIKWAVKNDKTGRKGTR